MGVANAARNGTSIISLYYQHINHFKKAHHDFRNVIAVDILGRCFCIFGFVSQCFISGTDTEWVRTPTPYCGGVTKGGGADRPCFAACQI